MLDEKMETSVELTRGEAVVLLNRLFGIQGKKNELFNDVEQGSDCAEAIGAASQLGLVRGTGIRQFSPRGRVRTLDYLVMLHRYLIGLNLLAPERHRGGTAGELELHRVPFYAREAVLYFQDGGYLAEGSVPGCLFRPIPRVDAIALLDKLRPAFLEYFPQENNENSLD